MKGIAVETIIYVIILILALAVLVFVITKMVPSFGSFIENMMKSIKESFEKYF